MPCIWYNSSMNHFNVAAFVRAVTLTCFSIFAIKESMLHRINTKINPSSNLTSKLPVYQNLNIINTNLSTFICTSIHLFIFAYCRYVSIYLSLYLTISNNLDWHQSSFLSDNFSFYLNMLGNVSMGFCSTWARLPSWPQQRTRPTHLAQDLIPVPFIDTNHNA